MPNKTALAASAALVASAVLSDLRNTPKKDSTASLVPAAQTAVAAVPGGGTAGGIASVVPRAPTALASSSGSQVAFSGKIAADRSNCNPSCRFVGVFTVVNNGPAAVDLALTARLASVRGEALNAEISPASISVGSYDGKIVPVTLTPTDERCRVTWTWIGSLWPFTRPAPTGCMPATGYCLIHVTTRPNPATGVPKSTKDRNKARNEAPEPKVVQERIDLGLSVPSPAGLESQVTMYSAIIAGVVVIIALIGLGLKKVTRHTLSIGDLDFDNSIVANVAFAGAGLTAVGLSTVIPDNTQLMTKQSYAALAVFAATLTLFAPGLFRLGKRRVRVDGEEQLVGRVWVTAFSAGLLLWGALISIATFWLQLIEVSESGAISIQSLSLFSYVLLAAALAISVYVPVSVITTAEREASPAAMPSANAARPGLVLKRGEIPLPNAAVTEADGREAPEQAPQAQPDHPLKGPWVPNIALARSEVPTLRQKPGNWYMP